MEDNRTWAAMLSGAAGAAALTLLHQGLKTVTPDAPRADALGREALAKGFAAAGEPPPDDASLQQGALAGDLAGNALYYSAVGLAEPQNGIRTGSLLGLAAGLGAVLLPGPLGFDASTTNRTPQTKVMAVAVYLAGGLMAGVLYQSLGKRGLLSS